jgi:co-chaperonin GroES (HSP10)
MSAVLKMPKAKAPKAKTPEPEFTWNLGEPHYGTSKRLGLIDNPTKLFERDKRYIWERVGNLKGFQLAGNNVLVAIWVTTQNRTGSIILPETTANEDKWQGKAGMVIGMGPHAYVSDQHRTFLNEEIPAIGDWVLFRKGDGPMLQVWGHECIMLDDQSIRAILDRPDAVF